MSTSNTYSLRNKSSSPVSFPPDMKPPPKKRSKLMTVQNEYTANKLKKQTLKSSSKSASANKPKATKKVPSPPLKTVQLQLFSDSDVDEDFGNQSTTSSSPGKKKETTAATGNRARRTIADIVPPTPQSLARNTRKGETSKAKSSVTPKTRTGKERGTVSFIEDDDGDAYVKDSNTSPSKGPAARIRQSQIRLEDLESDIELSDFHVELDESDEEQSQPPRRRQIMSNRSRSVVTPSKGAESWQPVSMRNRRHPTVHLQSDDDLDYIDGVNNTGHASSSAAVGPASNSLSTSRNRTRRRHFSTSSSASDRDTDASANSSVSLKNTPKLPRLLIERQKTTSERRVRRPWSNEEFEALQEGMRIYKANWATIKDAPMFRHALRHRNIVDLKDKARAERNARFRLYGDDPVKLGVFALVSGRGGEGAKKYY